MQPAVWHPVCLQLLLEACATVMFKATLSSEQPVLSDTFMNYDGGAAELLPTALSDGADWIHLCLEGNLCSDHVNCLLDSEDLLSTWKETPEAAWHFCEWDLSKFSHGRYQSSCRLGSETESSLWYVVKRAQAETFQVWETWMFLV